ncbi:MAG: TorF family putative porin [Hydrogenophilus sp.]|nr:TorF family putative porin [Hydrogenophilus sp.]
MKTTLSSLSLTALLVTPALAFANSPLTANVTLASEYIYRGISQTNEKPALQAGLDWAGSDGWYVGLWGSNISWLADLAPGSSSSVEIDLYGGKKWTIGSTTLDLGLLQYYYPGSYSADWKALSGLKTPHTTEVYAALTYGPATFKLSYALTPLFGTPESRGSTYWDLTLAPELTAGITAVAHVGRQIVAGSGNADYTDWKLGFTTKVGAFDMGLYYVDTDIKGSKIADPRLLLTLGKSF